MRVRHKNYPELGIGVTIDETTSDGKVDVKFERGVIRFHVTDLDEATTRRVATPAALSAPYHLKTSAQSELMLNILKRGETPSRGDLTKMGFGNPNAVIMGLRNSGYNITTVRVAGDSCRYTLAPTGENNAQLA